MIKGNTKLVTSIDDKEEYVTLEHSDNVQPGVRLTINLEQMIVVDGLEQLDHGPVRVKVSRASNMTRPDKHDAGANVQIS